MNGFCCPAVLSLVFLVTPVHASDGTCKTFANPADCARSKIVPHDPLGAAQFDALSTPQGVLQADTLQKFWKTYEKAPKCLQRPIYDPPTKSEIPPLNPEEFRSQTITSPFPISDQNPACNALGLAVTAAPKPIISVKSARKAADGSGDIDVAIDWFTSSLALARYNYYEFQYHESSRAALAGALVNWARANALSSGTGMAIVQTNVDGQVTVLIEAIEAAYVESAAGMTVDENLLVGPWVNRIIANLARGASQHREDYRVFQKAYATLVWGLAVGNKAVVQQAIDTYKLGIADMRPDGSFPVDSQRGGFGLDNNAKAAGGLFMIAALLKKRLDVDLFAYNVDGRSIHTAVSFVVAGILDPSLNKKYGRLCAGGGDSRVSVESPSNYYAKEPYYARPGEAFNASYLIVYATMFPNRPVSVDILKQYATNWSIPIKNEIIGGIAACLMDAKVGGKSSNGSTPQ